MGKTTVNKNNRILLFYLCYFMAEKQRDSENFGITDNKVKILF